MNRQPISSYFLRGASVATALLLAEVLLPVPGEAAAGELFGTPLH